MGEYNLIQLLAFDDVTRSNIEDLLAFCTELGPPLIEFGFLIKNAFDKCRGLIEYGLLNNAPTHMKAFFDNSPLAKAIKEISDFRDKYDRNGPFFNHLSTVSESIMALTWITITPGTSQYIKDLNDAGKYFGNRVLAAHKGEPNHTGFVNKYSELLKALELYVKQYFLTGFTWGSAQGGLNQPRPNIPPPPMPPPPPLPTYGDVVATGDGVREALIRDLNQGSSITNRLKHVERREETRSRAAPVKASTSSGDAPSKPAKSQETTAKAPIFMLEGRKWLVENYKDDRSMELDNDMTQSLAMYKCSNTILCVNNKINNVCIDSCEKVGILIKGGVISCVEVINCKNLKIQCDGIVPLINLSRCHNVQVFVNEQSKGVEVISSMSTSTNMCMIKTDGDYLEYPVPELIKSVFDGSKLKSSVVETI